VRVAAGQQNVLFGARHKERSAHGEYITAVRLNFLDDQ